MLLPVGAVSVVGVPVEKPVVATAETAGLQTAATPVAVLSSAVNTSVEGKLNLLLAAARERMFDSLLSAIDAASAVLNVSREPGESNAAFAQRVAVAIRSLSPQQLVVAQQKLDAQLSTRVPLPLLAEVLQEPESPQAVQLALNLERSAAAEPDAVLKAVVNSYGQNAGEAKPVPAQTQAPGAAPLQKVAALVAQAISPALPSEEPLAPLATQSTAQPSPAPQEASQPDTVAQSVPTAAQTVPLQAPAQNGAVPPQQATSASPNTGTATISPLQLASLVEDLAAGPLLAAIVAEATLPTEVELIRSPLAPPPPPRDIQQIQADLKQGLQVVISPSVIATNPDLMQIISNPGASVEKTIAQALTGNGAGQASQPQPPVDDNGRSRLVAASAIPVALAEEPELPVSAAALAGKSQPPAPSSAGMAMYDTAEQAGMPVQVPVVGVPFVVANYLPATTPAKTSESKRVDRVDPIADEEGERADDGETPQDQDDADSEQRDTQPQTAAGTPDDAESDLDASRQGATVTPELPALPQPSLADRQRDHAFDFYRRMVAWE
ncbi:hypothetical protein A6U86_32185 [Rhizobium sp. AC27/96]|uniref:hypothetical protein n=1 Tax=Rhizobium sp. AC27/96 TaxID=1841653 RepID=UPI000828945B|nr:hypothetical protein [Rhizobium sp. AC27/96]OCJ02445.1 hypothetical protein A6U86_32185 [Rhizobium sp. AC27/96]